MNTNDTATDAAAWRTELAQHGELFALLANHLPDELPQTKARFEASLAA